MQGRKSLLGRIIHADHVILMSRVTKHSPVALEQSKLWLVRLPDNNPKWLLTALPGEVIVVAVVNLVGILPDTDIECRCCVTWFSGGSRIYKRGGHKI